MVDPKFTISILAPDGWYTNRANVEIRIKDVNKTGWDTVEAKINSGGSWIDLTDDLVDKDKVSLEISENCTIYVTVTDKTESPTPRTVTLRSLTGKPRRSVRGLRASCSVWKQAMTFPAWIKSTSAAIPFPS